jgi:hypothetical protein
MYSVVIVETDSEESGSGSHKNKAFHGKLTGWQDE